MKQGISDKVNEIIINEDMSLSERFHKVAELYGKAFYETGDINYQVSAYAMNQAAEMMDSEKFKNLKR